jgi:L-ascorbate metabolism protein UlaG (beta-lactamase superfamily)
MSVERAGIRIETLPAYNIKKTQFHPRSAGHVGYVLTIDGVRIYHAGDTERIPEMKELNCDIALLPLGQTYTMNSVNEAAQAALDTKAKIAIPMHYDMYEGTPQDAERFKKLLEGKVRVEIQK